MRKSIRTMEASTNHADAPAHLSDEFPAGYSLMRCSPAELVAASPAGVNDAVARAQVRGFIDNDRSRAEKRNQFNWQQSTLTGQFFCPKNGETLKSAELLNFQRLLQKIRSFFGFSAEVLKLRLKI